MLASGRTLRIRSGAGLGDSLYLRPVAEHYARRGHLVHALTFYPDVFCGAASVETRPFERERVDVLAHYSHGKYKAGTTQWQDVCASAKVAGPLPLEFRWATHNHGLVSRLRHEANGRPIVLVHGGREPFGRRDGFGMELLPDPRIFEAVRAALVGCLTVRIGRGKQFYAIRTDVDLYGETTIRDLIDLGFEAEGIVGQCSFCVPLAEAAGKPLLAIFARRGLASKNRFLYSITPQKVLHGERSMHLTDDAPEPLVIERVRAFAAMLKPERVAA